MPRIDLEVPFSQKDEAKRLGARWDREKRVWYVPEGISSGPFKQWIPSLPSINVRADHYYIREASRDCWKCGGPTRVFAFALPIGHEVLDAIDDEDMEFESDEAYEAWANSPESMEWRVSDMLASIHYVDYLSRIVAGRIGALTPHFRVDFSKTTQSSYWMNHCEQCGMKQGDFDLHCESGAVFLPLYAEDVEGMIVHQVNQPFEANCGGYTNDVEFFELMKRRQ